jgi:type IV secretory pathway ATPase VirB11/archaellum biosynthesis ATPase
VSAAFQPLEELAAEVLGAEARAKALRAELERRMPATGVERLDVPGAGSVVWVKASTTSRVDVAACTAKVELLAARLQQLGVRDVDGSIPLAITTRSAGLRVTPLRS